MSFKDSFMARDGRLRAGWRVAAFLLAFVIVQIVIGCGAALAALALRGPAGLLKLGELLRGGEAHLLMLGGVVMLPVVMALAWPFRRFLDRRSYRSMGFWWDRRVLPDLGLGLVMGAGLILVMAAGLLLCGWYSWGPLVEGGEPGASPGWMLLSVAGLGCAAMMEEVLCRGYMQNNLTESSGPVHSIVITSAIFSVLHLGNPGVTLLATANLFLAGGLLGLVYHRFGTLWAPWALHFAWNFTMGPVLGVPVSGVRIPSIHALRLDDPDLVGWVATGGTFGFEGGLAATGVMAACILVLTLWKGRPARAPEPIRSGGAVRDEAGVENHPGEMFRGGD